MPILSASDLSEDLVLDCTVCVVGSGAGGGVLAERLVAAGVDVVMLEAGPHRPREQRSTLEQVAYPDLYQDRGARSTADGAITVLQGRSTGGGTLINWTTCFRTPDRILADWSERHGVELGDLDPHFDAVEERLHIAEWPTNNGNNEVLRRGCEALGWKWARLRRNVDGCANSGYCGLGCPFGVKQDQLITGLASAVKGGMRLYANCRAERLIHRDGEVVEVQAQAMVDGANQPTGVRVTVRPRVTVVAGGAINSPALLLRSDIDVDGHVGARTMLHPVVALPAIYPEAIEGWAGAPQSIGSHHFAEREGVGFFLECPPLQPMLAGSGLFAWGPGQAQFMVNLPRVASLLAILIDGLETEGGRVSLRRDGLPQLDYPVGPALQEAMKAAHEVMARIHLAAGASFSASLHKQPVTVSKPEDLPLLAAAPYGAFHTSLFTAHQMGGCSLGTVVDSSHRVHGFERLFVVDGSVLPTGLGVNPSETIYALAHRASDFVRDAT